MSSLTFVENLENQEETNQSFQKWFVHYKDEETLCNDQLNQSKHAMTESDLIKLVDGPSSFVELTVGEGGDNILFTLDFTSAHEFELALIPSESPIYVNVIDTDSYYHAQYLVGCITKACSYWASQLLTNIPHIVDLSPASNMRLFAGEMLKLMPCVTIEKVGLHFYTNQLKSLQMAKVIDNFSITGKSLTIVDKSFSQTFDLESCFDIAPLTIAVWHKVNALHNDANHCRIADWLNHFKVASDNFYVATSPENIKKIQERDEAAFDFKKKYVTYKYVYPDLAKSVGIINCNCGEKPRVHYVEEDEQHTLTLQCEKCTDEPLTASGSFIDVQRLVIEWTKRNASKFNPRYAVVHSISTMVEDGLNDQDILANLEIMKRCVTEQLAVEKMKEEMGNVPVKFAKLHKIRPISQNMKMRLEICREWCECVIDILRSRTFVSSGNKD